MPYEWLPREGDTETLHAWPYRSLPRKGFVWFIGGTALLLALPLLVLLGSPVLWGLLPFLLLAVAGIWFALERSYRDGEILEELRLNASTTTLTRTGPHKRQQSWQANTHWVRLERHIKTGPVPHYLTLKGGPREVELGAFLTEDERLKLAGEIDDALQTLRNVAR